MGTYCNTQPDAWLCYLEWRHFWDVCHCWHLQAYHVYVTHQARYRLTTFVSTPLRPCEEPTPPFLTPKKVVSVIFIGIFQSILIGVHLPHFAKSIVLLLIHPNTFYSVSAWIYSLGSSSLHLILFIVLLYHLHSQMCRTGLEPTLKLFWAKQFSPKNNPIQLLQLPPSISVF